MHTHGRLQFLDAMTDTDNSMGLSGRKPTSTQVLILNYCPDMPIKCERLNKFPSNGENLQELRRATVSYRRTFQQTGSVL